MDILGISQDDERQLCRHNSTYHSQNDNEHSLRMPPFAYLILVDRLVWRT
jgi:hypothetical protein